MAGQCLLASGGRSPPWRDNDNPWCIFCGAQNYNRDTCLEGMRLSKHPKWVFGGIVFFRLQINVTRVPTDVLGSADGFWQQAACLVRA